MWRIRHVECLRAALVPDVLLWVRVIVFHVSNDLCERAHLAAAYSTAVWLLVSWYLVPPEEHRQKLTEDYKPDHKREHASNVRNKHEDCRNAAYLISLAPPADQFLPHLP